MNYRIHYLIDKLGMRETLQGNIVIGKLSFSKNEITKHLRFQELENKIVDYIEQM